MKYNIKFSPPDISAEDINEVVDTLKSGWITTGPKTKLFEKKLAEYCGTDRVVCLNSATACMELVLRILGVQEGDEVITSAYTYTASCSVICHVGATPVLVDTYPDSLEMDYDALEKAINSKTKAIIPIDLAGVMCDYDRIFDIVERKKNLFTPKNEMQRAIGHVIVLEDAAHAFGASYKGKKCGTVGDFTCFSFHAIKNLTTSEGGAVTWKNIDNISNDEIYKQFMFLSLHGQTKDALEKIKSSNWEYDILYPGYKYNMSDILSSIGLSQLNHYDDSLLLRRKNIVKMYDEGLNNFGVKGLNHYNKIKESSGHLYISRIIGKDEKFRNDIILRMAQKGIPTNVHYKPLPMLTAYKNLGFRIKDFPNAYDFYKNEISLPLHTLLKDEEVEYIINTLKSFL